MDITVTHDFWGNVWLVKTDGTIVAHGTDKREADTYARNIFRVFSARGVEYHLQEDSRS